MRNKTLLILVIFFLADLYSHAFSQPSDFRKETNAAWVDSVLQTLTQDEQIAQLIFVEVYSDMGISHEVSITDLIRKYKIGGLVFFKGTAEKQASLTNYYQSQSKVPLMIAMNGEQGPGRYLENLVEFPGMMTLNAIQDDSLIYAMGQETGREFLRLGVHLNLIPFPATENDTGNTLKSFRSIEVVNNPESGKSGMVIKGMQDAGVISLAVRFPDIGDTAGLDTKVILGGNELLVLTDDVPKAIEEIKKAVNTGLISQKEIENRCRKLLAAKLGAGLDHPQKVKLKNLNRDLNSPGARVLNIQLTRAALTVLQNEDQVIPVKNLESTRIATLAIGTEKLTAYQKMLANYTKMDHFFWDPDDTEADSVFQKLKSYDLIIAGLDNPGQISGSHINLDDQLVDAVDRLVSMGNVVLSVFGNPFILDKFSGIENSIGLILTYQNTKTAQEQAAQLVFGAVGASGTLPVLVNEHFKQGTGIPVHSIARLAYTLPEEEGMDSFFLTRTIDSIARSSIDQKVFPGCEVLVARHGAVVFNKTYGFLTYEKKTPVTKDDLYDFASVTKATGPLPALMQLVDEGKIDLDAKFSTYWPQFRHSNKSDMTVREVLAHQAGLKAWIPYWKNTIKKNGKFKFHTFKPDSSAKYNVPVDDHLWLYKNYRKKMYKAIRKSPVSEKKKYLYSGLSFYLYPQIISNLTGEDYETYLKNHIYRPLGAYDLTFNPYHDYPLERIPPTEKDTFFRKTQIHGYVHDEGAAMMGGVSGNAGLFATANDLAKLLQMYLQMGYYGGRQIIEKSTLKEFSRCQYPDNDNRRGIGFDKPLLDNASKSTDAAYPAKSASPSSFGHSGYTGTFIWVDPGKDLIYVFFSNRVYPTRENNKISKMNIRSKVLEAAYESILK